MSLGNQPLSPGNPGGSGLLDSWTGISASIPGAASLRLSWVPRSPQWFSKPKSCLSSAPGLPAAHRLAWEGSLCLPTPPVGEAPACTPGDYSPVLKWPTQPKLPTSLSKSLRGTLACLIQGVLSNVPGAAGGGKRDTGLAPCTLEHGAQDTGLAGPSGQ